MTSAMTLPAAVFPAQHIAVNSFRRRQPTAVAGFVAVYLLVWLSFGVVATSALALLPSASRGTLALAAMLVMLVAPRPTVGVAVALTIAMTYEKLTRRPRRGARCVAALFAERRLARGSTSSGDLGVALWTRVALRCADAWEAQPSDPSQAMPTVDANIRSMPARRPIPEDRTRRAQERTTLHMQHPQQPRPDSFPECVDQAILHLLLSANEQRPRSQHELVLEIGDELEVADSLARLHRAGLIHRCAEFAWATRAATQAERLMM